MDSAAIDFLRGLPLDFEARAAMDGVDRLDALASALLQPSPDQTRVWPTTQTGPVAPSDTEATYIVQRMPASASPDDAYVTRVVARRTLRAVACHRLRCRRGAHIPATDRCQAATHSHRHTFW